MKREEIKENRLLIIRELENLYFDISKRMNEINLLNNKMHFDVYNDIWRSLIESTNIKMHDIDTMICFLDAININLTQLAMVNDCCYPMFVDRLKQIRLLVN
jgi:hypothetical protein